MDAIPVAFAAHIVAMHSEVGRAWLGRLPAVIADCARRWDLTIGPPFAALSYNYTAPATRGDGTPLVVKICAPAGEFAQQSEALRLFAGQGSARMVACDPGSATMLLERLMPGTPLSAISDDTQAIANAAAVMRQLWRPAPPEHPFPTVATWREGLVRLRQRYGGGTGPLPPALVAEAEALYAALSASMAPPMVLHGDLHQDNILAATREPWLAIDPKGLVGEPAYELGPLLHNPLPQLLEAPQPGRVIAHRIDQLAEELGLDRSRVRGWGLYQAVLAAWWDIEDMGAVRASSLACAELLAAINR